MNDNELTTLDAVEREIRARYNGKYQSARKLSGYKSGCCSTLTN